MAETTPSRTHTETLHEYVTRQWQSHKDERASWIEHYEDITRYVAPWYGRYLVTDTNKGRKRNKSIIDGAATQAGRTLIAGMHSGLTSPARPWIRFGTEDPDMMDYGPVREWVARGQELVLRILAKSNFYNAIQRTYGELGHFGTNVLYREKDFRTFTRFYPFTVGEYAIAEDDTARVNTCYREFEMTVRQCVAKFGYENCSRQTRNNYDNSEYNTKVVIIHAMEPNDGRDQTKVDNRNLPFRSVYIEKGSQEPIKTQEDQTKALRFSGYRRQPFYGIRWDILFGDLYGRSPGMDALGDVRQLQMQQRRKGQGIDKMVNPPLIGHPSLKNKGAVTLPGSVNYADSRSGRPALEPVYTVQPRVDHLVLDMGEVRERINKWYYADLFAMMIESDRREITATEVAVRQQEKLVLLGPVLQRMNSELFDPLITDLFEEVVEAGMMPPPPPELQGQELNIEYVSLLQQAQQAVGVNSMDRLFGFVGGVAEMNPEVIDKLDFDEAVNEYAHVLGVPEDVVRSDEDVIKIRQQRAEQQRQIVQQEQAAVAAETAKTMSDTKVGDNNALEEVLSGVGTLGSTPAAGRA